MFACRVSEPVTAYLISKGASLSIKRKQSLDTCLHISSAQGTILMGESINGFRLQYIECDCASHSQFIQQIQKRINGPKIIHRSTRLSWVFSTSLCLRMQRQIGHTILTSTQRCYQFEDKERRTPKCIHKVSFNASLSILTTRETKTAVASFRMLGPNWRPRHWKMLPSSTFHNLRLLKSQRQINRQPKLTRKLPRQHQHQHQPNPLPCQSHQPSGKRRLPHP